MPERIEFWQGGEHRLHDRFVYRRGAEREWEIEQLQP
jgi:pyridoxamine 5'-phosphate oxidase